MRRQRQAGRTACWGGGVSAVLLALSGLCLGQAELVRVQPLSGSADTVAVSDSAAYVGGTFSFVGPRTGSGALVNAETGTLSADLGVGEVSKAIFDGSGGYYLAGAFESIHGQPRENLARIDRNGDPFSSFVPVDHGFFQIETLALDEAGERLYAGGESFYSNAPSPQLTAFDSITGSILPWNPQSDGEVRHLVVTPDGKTLFAAGAFREIGGASRLHLAALDTSTATALPWNPELDEPAHVTSMALSPDGTQLYLGGILPYPDNPHGFSDVIAVFDTATGAALADPLRLEPPGATALDFAVSHDGSRLFVGGAFNQIAGESRSQLAEIDTAAWTVSPWVISADGKVQSVELSPDDSTLYLGGDFFTVNNQPRSRAAAVSTEKGQLLPWNPSASSRVQTVSSSPDSSTVFIGGRFNSLGGRPRDYLAAFSIADGELTDWAPEASNTVSALELDTQRGILYASGPFSRIDNKTRRGLAAMDATSGSLLDWNPGSRVNLIGGSELLLLGRTSLYGQWPIGPQSFALDSGQTTPWAPDLWLMDLIFAGGTSPVSGRISAAVLSEDKTSVFLGGPFRRVNDVNRYALGSVSASNGTLLPWDPGLKAPPLDPDNTLISIQALALDPQHSILVVGGELETSFGSAHQHLVALDPGTGELLDWMPEAPPISMDHNALTSLLILPEHRLLIVGVSGHFSDPSQNPVIGYDLLTGALRPVVSHVPYVTPHVEINAIRISPDGSRLVVAANEFVAIYDTSGLQGLVTHAKNFWLYQ